jgi:carbon storage regulator
MLVLSRRCGQEIVIGNNIHIAVLSMHGGQVRLGITAPRSVTVDRQEVHNRRSEDDFLHDDVEPLVVASR